MKYMHMCAVCSMQPDLDLAGDQREFEMAQCQVASWRTRSRARYIGRCQCARDAGDADTRGKWRHFASCMLMLMLMLRSVLALGR
jgi:hypothetical protein